MRQMRVRVFRKSEKKRTLHETQEGERENDSRRKSGKGRKIELVQEE